MQRSRKKWLEAYLKSSLRIIVALMPMKEFLVITRLIGVPRSRSFELEHDL